MVDNSVNKTIHHLGLNISLAVICVIQFFNTVSFVCILIILENISVENSDWINQFPTILNDFLIMLFAHNLLICITKIYSKCDNSNLPLLQSDQELGPQQKIL